MTDHPLEETLDPDDWDTVLTIAHKMIEDAGNYTRNVRDEPVWRALPEPIVQSFQTPLPQEPTALSNLMKDINETLMPFPMGNTHPRFWMWFMGSSNFTGAMADFIAAVQGSNLGGGQHAAAAIDQQVVDWCKEIVGFPKNSSGTLVSGGSMANMIGLTVARNEAARKGPDGSGRQGIDLRKHGIAGLRQPLRFYASDQIHICHVSALESLGLGSNSLCKIPTDTSCKLDLKALRSQIIKDRAAGIQPAAIIANAGTVNTGAIDDLTEIATLCREEGIWFHIDGCIGALIAMAPNHAHLVEGLAMADSIALDPHKWLHAPFDVGCALVRNAEAHRQAFAQSPEYLQETTRGIAAAPWLNDYSVHTTRGFRALKVWLALREHGAAKFGRLIDQNIRQARYLADKIAVQPDMQLLFPSDINIVCFRYHPEGWGFDAAQLEELNMEILFRLQESGAAAFSDTRVHGVHCLRVAICNHRTRYSDLDYLVDKIQTTAAAILAE